MDRDAADRVVCIGSVADIVAARQQGRSLASALGFSSGDLTVIATAISEIARNILDPMTNLLFSNRLEDNKPIDELRAAGMTIDEAIAEVLRSRGVAV